MTAPDPPANTRRRARERAAPAPESAVPPDEAVAQPPVQRTDQTAAGPDEAIRTRAYFLFLERGGTPGCELDDWLQAEREHSAGMAP